MTRDQFIAHVEESQRALRRFLVALCCGDGSQADDIAQEAYIKAYLAIDGFSGNPEKFNAWIFRITYNTFLDHRRSAKVYSDYNEASNMACTSSADDSFKYQELYDALQRLSAKERTSILLYYMEGYSIKEIAKIIETSESAVKQHLSRGRTHLRGLLTTQ